MSDSDPGTVIGRDDELTLVDELCKRLSDGTGGALWIDGDPGIGKTTVCDALAESATRRGLRVLRASASEPFQVFPLRTVLAALDISIKSPDRARREIAELMRGGGAGVLDPVLAAAERILEIVDHECSATPVVLIIEDLQWADEATLLLWERIAQGLDQIPLVLAGTCHPAPLRPEVSRLRAAAHDGLAVTRELAPLTPAEVTELAVRLLGAEPDPALAAELRHTGGNPLYVREIVAGWPGDEGGRLPTVDAAIGRRLRLLGEEARTVLRLAALLGREFEVGHLAAASGRTAAELAPVLTRVSAAGTLAEAGDRFVFRHELVRRVLAEETPAPVRVALHAQIARALARSGADVQVVARHLLVTDGTLESWSISWLARIPEAAYLVAPQPAVELLTRAVRALAPADERWAALAGGLVAVCFMLGRDELAETTAAHVAQEVRDPDVRARMQLYRMRLASRQGRIEEALAIAEAALNDPDLSPLWSARLRARSGAVLLKCGRTPDALPVATRSLAEATAVADPIGIGHSHLVLAYRCDPAGALEHFDAGLTGLGSDADSTELRMLLLSNRLAALNNLGRAAEFKRSVDDTMISLARMGVARAGVIAVSAAMGLFDFGAWDDALVQLAAVQPPVPDSVRILRIGLAALIAGHREDWARLRAEVQEGGTIPVTAGDARIFSGYLVAARALRAEADGDPARAADELSCWLADDLVHDARERFMWLPTLTRLALTLGDRSLARAAASAVAADAASPTALVRQVLTATFCQAQLDDDVPELRRVAAAAEEHGWLMLRAAADEETAARLAAAGDEADARAALGDAVRGYLTVGATFDVRRADARLRAHGVRRGPRSAHRRPESGWDALTPTEARVAELVTAGRSNPDIAAELFMSRRTAQTHVSRVLRKLNSSRLDLIRAAPRPSSD